MPALGHQVDIEYNGDITIFSVFKVAPIEVGWGAVAPSPRFPNFLSLVSLIQCSIYVHAYPVLVHFST